MVEQEDDILRVVGLEKKFPGTEAIAGLSFTVKRGEVVCVIGPNGAGKSTLLYLLAGLIYPSAGHVSVFGLNRWSENHAIRCRSITLPDTPLVGESPSPWEYLRYLAQIYGLSKDEFLQRVDRMAGQLNYRPYLNRNWSQLSLGLYKKAGLIGCFLPDVELRIMDEPFAGGIDPIGMEMMYRWIRLGRERGETIIFSTQVLDQAQSAADRIILLQDGRIAADGSPVELIRAAGLEPEAPRALARAFIALAARNDREKEA